MIGGASVIVPSFGFHAGGLQDALPVIDMLPSTLTSVSARAVNSVNDG